MKEIDSKAYTETSEIIKFLLDSEIGIVFPQEFIRFALMVTLCSVLKTKGNIEKNNSSLPREFQNLAGKMSSYRNIIIK